MSVVLRELTNVAYIKTYCNTKFQDSILSLSQLFRQLVAMLIMLCDYLYHMGRWDLNCHTTGLLAELNFRLSGMLLQCRTGWTGDAQLIKVNSTVNGLAVCYCNVQPAGLHASHDAWPKKYDACIVFDDRNKIQSFTKIGQLVQKLR
jgi:hypothetical protein